MELVTFNSADDLVNFFRNTGEIVGPRKGPKKRTQNQKELYNLRQYLPTLAANGQLKFPLTIEKSESPDFLITEITNKWGLEVTEATTKEHQRELTITEGDETTLMPLGRDGWVGNSAERETCAAILRAMRRKVRKIRSGKYQSASRYDLLIYVNVRAFFYDNGVTVDLLKESISKWHLQWGGLGHVNVIASCFLYYDVINNQTEFPLFKYEIEEFS